MAEKIKDGEDRLLESMFASRPVSDDGFSLAVVTRLKRRLWFRRLLLPSAAAIGGVIALKPIAGLVTALKNVSFLIPDGLLNATTSAIPQLQTIVLGALLLVVCLLGAQALQD